MLCCALRLTCDKSPGGEARQMLLLGIDVQLRIPMGAEKGTWEADAKSEGLVQGG